MYSCLTELFEIELFLYARLNCLFINGFRTVVFIFIVISTTFRPIYPPAFFRCLSNSRTFTELQTTSFIESMGVTCSNSVNHNQVQVLSTRLQSGLNLQPPDDCPLRSLRNQYLLCCVLLDNSSTTLNDKNHQASSQKFRQLNCLKLNCFDI